jgi:hypothetical protein
MSALIELKGERDYTLDDVAMDLVRTINERLPMKPPGPDESRYHKDQSFRAGPVYCIKSLTEPEDRHHPYGDKFHRLWLKGARLVIVAETEPDGVFLHYSLDSTFWKAKGINIKVNPEVLLANRNCMVLDKLASI